MLLRYFFLTLTLCSLSLLKAQEPAAIHLTEKDGLPDIEFYDILEDSQGYIWLAADNGLYRYDGRYFKNYTNGDKRGLSVFELREDAKGRIWCINITGQLFYVDNDELISFVDLREKLGGILGSYEIDGDTLYIFGNSKLIAISLTTRKQEVLLEAGLISFLKRGDDGTIFFSAGDRLYVLKDGHFKSMADYSQIRDQELKNDPYRGVPQILLSERDSLLIYRKETSFDVFRLGNLTSPDKKILSEVKNLYISKILRVGEQFWITSNKGLHIYDKELTYIASHLQQYFITDVARDRDDNYWITTLRSGVFVIPNIHIQTFPKSSALNINSLEKVGNRTLIFGTVDGKLGTFDITEIKIDVQQLESDFSVSAIAYNSDKNLTYVSLDNSSYVLDMNSKKLLKSRGFSNAKDIAIYDENTILFTSYYGVATLKNAFQFQPDEAKFIINNRRGYTCFKSIKTGNFYVATVDDLLRYDATLSSQSIRNEEKAIFATSITETTDGTLWVSTFKNGIYGILNDEVVISFDEKDGLLTNEIALIKGDGNHLWIVSDKGLQYLDTQYGDLRTLNSQDGIPSRKISGIQVMGKRVFFSTNEGFFSIHKAQAFKRYNAPEIRINSVKIMGKDTLLSSQYELPYEKNRMTVTFQSNTFQSTKNITYEHRLLGGNEEWSALPAGVNEVQFNSLSNGKYVFEVRAINNTAKIGSEVKSIKIKVLKPFWLRWWFATVLFILALGIIVFTIKRRQKLLIRKKQQELVQARSENRMTALKLENLRSQMNPHFIFNALNSIQEYIVLNKKNEASDYLGKFSDLIRGYLSSSVADMISIRDEIEGLETYLSLEKMRFEEEFTYTLSFSDELVYQNFEIPTMLLQPFLENSLKHGLLHKKGAKKLSLKAVICEENGMSLMKVIIEDNGVGRLRASAFSRKRKPNHKSFSSKATEDRLALLNKQKHTEVGITYTDLYDSHDQAIGTKVTIIIPLQ